MRSLAKKIYGKLGNFAARAVFSPRCRRIMNRLAAVFLFALVATAFFVPKQTHAQGLFDIGTIASNAIGYFFFVILYIVSYIAATIIAVITYLISIFLALNTHVVDAFAVQTGFSVALSIANLGFVLGIIVIAIATILRSQTYGIKQILWKLVVAAILVNFGLVIAGALLGVANSFTTYFMSALPGGLPGNQSYDTFASALAGAMKPHSLILNFDSNATNKVPTADDTSGAAQAGATLGALLQPIINTAFVAGFLIVIVITLVVFLFMLIIRYLYLGILLILMPFAWLMWIFPKFSHLWTKWWNMFLKWTFFAPIVMFFLYLAISTASVMNNSNSGANPGMNPLNQIGELATKNSTQGALKQFMGGAVQSTLVSFLQILLIIGLAVGGMIAANSMSITGAGVAMGAMKSVGNAAAGYAGKLGKKGGRFAWQKAGGEKIEKSLREGRMGAQLKKVGLKNVGGLVQRGESLAGRAVGGMATNEGLVKEAAKNVPKDWRETKRDLAGNMNNQDNFAHIADLVRQGKLKEDDMVGNMKAGEYLDQKDLVKRFGQGKLLEDANKLFGNDSNSRNSARAMKAGGKEKEEFMATRKEEHKKNVDRVLLEMGNDPDEATRRAAPAEAERAATLADEDAFKNYLKKQKKDPETKVKVVKDVEDENGKVIYKEGAMAPAEKLKKAADDDFMAKLKKAEAGDMDVNTRFGPKASKADVDSTARSIAEFNPQIVSTLMRNMLAPALTNFSQSIKKGMDEVMGKYQKKIEELKKDPTAEVQRRVIAQKLDLLKKQSDNFDRLLLNNLGAVGRVEKSGEPEIEAPETKPEGGGSNK